MRCFRAAIHERLGCSSDLVVCVVITINYDDNIADFISPGHSTAPGDSPPAPTPTSLNVPAINIIGANHQRVSPAGFIFFSRCTHELFTKEGLGKVPEENKTQLSFATLVKSMTKLKAGNSFKTARQKSVVMDQKKNSLGENLSCLQEWNNEQALDNKFLQQ